VLVLECISSSSSFSFINEVDMRNMIYMDKQTNKQTNKQTIKRIGTQSKNIKRHGRARVPVVILLYSLSLRNIQYMYCTSTTQIRDGGHTGL